MFLTATNLPHYLIARGLVTPASIVDGDFAVVEAGRRNRNFKVLRAPGAGLFVKQIRNQGTEAVETLAREAACYRLARENPDLSALAELMPGYVDHDPARSVLVVDLLPEGENLTEHHLRLGGFPEATARRLGLALAAYHAGLAGRLDGRPEAALFPRRVPWILTLEQNGYAILEQNGRAPAELAAVLRGIPELAQRLAAIAREWRADSLIHGDMKWDNCVVTAGPDGEPALRVIDWELADVGDAAWDVGAIFQCYFVFLLLAVPVRPDLPPAWMVEQAVARLGEARPALRAFWEAYATARGFSLPAARPYLERCLRFGAGRMILSVVEHMYYQPQLTHSAHAMIQASLRFLRDPGRAAWEMVGA